MSLPSSTMLEGQARPRERDGLSIQPSAFPSLGPSGGRDDPPVQLGECLPAERPPKGGIIPVGTKPRRSGHDQRRRFEGLPLHVPRPDPKWTPEDMPEQTCEPSLVSFEWFTYYWFIL